MVSRLKPNLKSIKIIEIIRKAFSSNNSFLYVKSFFYPSTKRQNNTFLIAKARKITEVRKCSLKDRTLSYLSGYRTRVFALKNLRKYVNQNTSNILTPMHI